MIDNRKTKKKDLLRTNIYDILCRIAGNENIVESIFTLSESMMLNKSRDIIRLAKGVWSILSFRGGMQSEIETTRVFSVHKSEHIYQVEVFKTYAMVSVGNGTFTESGQNIFTGYVFIRHSKEFDILDFLRKKSSIRSYRLYPISVDDLFNMWKEYIISYRYALLNKKKVSTTTISYKVGELVEITEGPLKNAKLYISSVNQDGLKVSFLVNMFGRQTPVDVPFDHIKRV